MITKWMNNYIEEHTAKEGIALNDKQKDFLERKGLLSSDMNVLPAPAFKPSYSFSNKETDELLETPANTGDHAVSYVKAHPNNYMFAEEPAFATIGIDGVVIEMDDVFGTITALFGLQVQKKHGEWLKKYIDAKLGTAAGTRSLMFSADDGLWDVNIAMDYVDGFAETKSFDETLELVYEFVFNMLVELEDAA
ncbi:hypothetical protein [Sporosarcina aquimarina]|uniref:Branched-chain amino acid aminotransferase n=1 Tax=Sporosarcina aquimarina TaxID=114975 RepID=A0ABU4FZT2_9BACL|nr:hypothetical protein [Sporosarcina aquimarina]MDW0110224.1 hypothetical protein [Sporosarcina aquimarina]